MEAGGELPKSFSIFLTPGGLACAKKRKEQGTREVGEGRTEGKGCPSSLIYSGRTGLCNCSLILQNYTAIS